MNQQNHKILSLIAVLGDIVYILWILYNAVDEGFKNIRSIEAVALGGLIILLLINIKLINERKNI